MTHDPLCPWLSEAGLPDKFGMMERATCRCWLIAKVREDERANITAEFMSNHGDRWEYEQGQRDMLAKCIAAVEAAVCNEADSTRAHDRYDCCGCSTIDAMAEDALAALRALQEKP